MLVRHATLSIFSRILPIKKGRPGAPATVPVKKASAGFFTLAQTTGSFGHFFDLHDLSPSWSNSMS
jgi:hypothetical protein